jgi:hypothetical protein
MMAARVLNGWSREAECSRPDNTGGAASRTRPLTDLDQEAVRLGLLDLFAGIIDVRKIGVRAAPRFPAEGNDDPVGDGYADVQRLAVRGDLVGTAEEAGYAGYAEFALLAVDEVVGLQVDGVDEPDLVNEARAPTAKVRPWSGIARVLSSGSTAQVSA